MNARSLHRSVLLEEAVEALKVQPGGCYLDGTFGRGGHTSAILRLVGQSGRVLALDKDEQAVAYGRKAFAGESRLTLVHGSFASMRKVARAQHCAGRIKGVLLDLGVSSPQLDEAQRGFSFQQDGPLDMRMDRATGESAAQWLATAEEQEISKVLWELGEERFARRIARAIVETRGHTPLRSTVQLADLISLAIPAKERRKHPATRSFQAIRIHLNRELEELRDGLRQAVELLSKGGRLVVISFHSLEDRIVKRFLREQARGEVLPKGVPVTAGDLRAGCLKVLGKPVRASAQELAQNPRARSAIMRVAEKIC